MDAGKEKESSLNLTFLKKIPWLKILKMTVGAVLAMELAGLLHLEYAASAGVIAFLTIQDTRQETSSSALRRGIAFCIMTLLCLPIFSLLGNRPWAFGIFFPLFLLICFTCRMEDSIAVNTVLATHYMAAGGVSLPMLKNECGLLLVGVGLGILLNSFMPNNLRRIQAKQSELDTELQQILHRMAIHVLKTEHPDYDGSCFHRTDQLLTEMEQETVRFMRNHYLEQDLYFMQYLMMRREQCEILRMIYRQICKLTLIPTQAKPLSDYLQKPMMLWLCWKNWMLCIGSIRNSRCRKQENSLKIVRFYTPFYPICVLCCKSSSSSLCHYRKKDEVLRLFIENRISKQIKTHWKG